MSKTQADADLLACEQDLGYTFDDRDLLEAAVTHSSSANTRQDSNERMEFLGDAVLDLVVCEALYARLPEAMEGELTRIKSAVVSGKACARVADEIGLPRHLRLGQGMESGEQMPRSLAAAALEAIIAAVYLDGGLEAAGEFILRVMDGELERAINSQHQYNFKSQLQQHAQKNLGATPLYELLDEKGPDHARCFEVAVSIGSQHFPGTWGPSKKEAEQKAARLALVSLGILADDLEE